MKIEGPGRTSGARGPSRAGSAKKTGDASFSSLVEETGAASAAASVSGPSAISGIEAFLSLQGVGEEGGASGKGKRRAISLLDQLDRIRMGLLNGGIEKSVLDQLERMVSVQRDMAMDPELSALLDEIDLRVQVELAKYNRA